MQPSPDGLALAGLLTEDFIVSDASAMVLGDNIFFGHAPGEVLAAADAERSRATVFGHRVADPERNAVPGFDAAGQVRKIVEKPAEPPSKMR